MTCLITLQWAAIVLTSATLVGCRAAPARNAGFADPALMKPDPAVGFNKFWRKPGVDWKHYDKLYVAEVNTSYMLKMTEWQKGERRAQIEQDVRELAGRARGMIVKAFREDPHHRFQVIDSRTNAPRTLVLEVALTEVVPSKVLLNALGYAPFYVGTGISVVRTIANDKSSAAFEARVRDASSGDIVMLAADREAEQFAIIDVRGLTWYSDAEGIINEWSKQFVLLANAKPGEKVPAMPTFRLLPW
jgi:Protein of unknown function (DUF3313)